MDNQTPPQQNANISTEFWGHLRLGLLLLGTFILTIYGKCAKNHNNETETPKKITIGNTHLGSRKKDSHDKISETYIPPEGGVTITPKDKNKTLEDIINVHKQIMGITFEPGLSTAFPMYPSIGLDAKLLYYERYGAGVGILGGTGLTAGFSPYVFVSRRIDDKLSLLKNTELWAGYVPFNKIPVALGIRINL